MVDEVDQAHVEGSPRDLLGGFARETDLLLCGHRVFALELVNDVGVVAEHDTRRMPGPFRNVEWALSTAQHQAHECPAAVVDTGLGQRGKAVVPAREVFENWLPYAGAPVFGTATVTNTRRPVPG